MTSDQRLDYFRSEFKGEVARLEKQMADDRKVMAVEFVRLADQLANALRELKYLQAAVR
jgi:5'-deoxynucleotidase YfbR-like HD superfamily hydrolase